MKLWGKSRFRGGKIRRKWLAEQIANGRIVMAVGHCADIAVTLADGGVVEATVKTYLHTLSDDHDLMDKVYRIKATQTPKSPLATLTNTFTPPDDVERMDLGWLVEK